jgi:hypothetical protein
MLLGQNCHTPQDCSTDNMEQWWNDDQHRILKELIEEPAPVPLSPPPILHEIA